MSTTTNFPWQHIPAPGKMYGTATVGERGQISIPADARRELSINSGDKVVVFGNKLNGAVIILKADVFEDFVDFFMKKLNKLGEHAQDFFGQFVSSTQLSDDAEGDGAAGDSAPSE